MAKQTEQPQVLKIKPPSPDTPGYLLRVKRVRVLRAFLANPSECTDEQLQEVVNFILTFVEEPADREKAEELLWSISQAEFGQILGAIGGTEESTVPLVRNGK